MSVSIIHTECHIGGGAPILTEMDMAQILEATKFKQAQRAIPSLDPTSYPRDGLNRSGLLSHSGSAVEISSTFL